MAKGKGKQSSGANSIPVKGSAVEDASNAGANAFPELEESAFAGLRQKIEQRLKDGANKQKAKFNKSEPAPVEDAKNTKQSSAKPDSKSRSGSDKNNQGKKRDRNGDVISRDGKKQNKSQSLTSTDGDDTLRQEILALGGTEEDFEMLAGVDSDEEEDADTSKKSKGKSDEASLRKELSSMLAAAGQFVPEDLEDDDVEEEAEAEDEEDADIEEDEDEDEDEDESEPSSESESPEEPPKQGPKQPAKKEVKETEPEVVFPKEFSKLTVRPRSDWFMMGLGLISSKQTTGLPRHLVDRVYHHAVSLLEKENKMYSDAQQASASSSYKFYSTIMTTGTLSDKISALTLAVQESPLHNTKSLENLVALGKKRSRAQAVEVLRSLKDMFAQGTLLPGDRRLRSFANQPSLIAAFQGAAGSKWTEGSSLPGGLQNSHLIVWAYEHFLKEQYFEVLKILEVWCNDEIEFSRSRAVSYVFELLKEKPEQEANLLRLLVNKLGDTSKKIASRASYLLLQLEQAHPLMKPTIVKSVEEVLFRPGQSQHAKYYSIITLNQTVLSSKEEAVGVQLLDIYFSLFVALLKPSKNRKFKGDQKHGKGKKQKGKGQKDKDNSEVQTEEMQDKLVSAVLTGVNRAYPFTSSNTERLSKHIETLFRITHSSNFNTSIQALMLIQQLTSTHQVSSDRFYRTLYESLLDPRVATSSKQSLYLNLLFKALKNDVNIRRVKAFVKRIVQVLGLHQPSFICGVFYLIRELEKAFMGLQSLYDQPEDNESDDEEVFRDVPDEDDENQEQAAVPEKPKKPFNGYDPRKRDPEHSNADKACLWEILPYLSHFHPSVSVNAAHLLENQTMSGKPDMTIHTLTHFLDRFVYRTPKAAAATRGSSLMQPLAGSDAKDRLVTAGKHAQALALNSEAFWKKKAEDVSAEDVFFHEYFSRLGKDKEKAQKKKKSKDAVERDEEGDEDLSDAESEIWKALVDSRPELDGAESDDDLDLDDLESAYGQSDEEGGEDEVIFNDESDEEMEDVEDEFEEEEAEEPATKSKKPKSKEDEFDDEDAFDMDVSDEEAFIDSDEELPSDVELGGVELPKEEDKSDRKKKRKLKHLPTFASVDDYAALLAGEDEGM
ncbi:CBF/Mak21 family-domain-containing protein [Aspergillus pseudoustus]|uniref:CBF/Mak21 family-domain-containing protein n=1 Tax=Aspergillus pseudoustus TaxID=1810923 RepID=A0ABR4IYJ4_9EURO